MSSTISFINSLGLVLAAVVEITPEIKQLVLSAKNALDGKEPTDEDWAALHALQDKNTAALDSPMEGEK